MKTKHLILGLFATAITFTSCTDDEGVKFIPTVPGVYENGLLLINEGGFGSGNASASFISNDYSTTENDIFTAVNSSPLGDTAQSMAFYNDLAYIVVNGSDKIEVVNKNTFVSIATIDIGLDNPRYITFANGKGYVTNWGDGVDSTDDFIAVVDLVLNTVTSTIPVTEGPEQITVVNGKIYLSHKGGFGQGNTISVIASDNSVTTISVGDLPDEMVVDSANNLWVVCAGKPSWTGTETAGKLILIDTTTDTVTTTLNFATTEHPDELTMDNGMLYYAMDGSVYAMNETATILPTTAILTATTYAMEANNGKLYTTDAGNYVDPGTLKIFDLSDNSEIQTITVGVIPGGIYFN